MRATRFATCFLFGLSLGGCGTYVPNIQEFPLDTADAQLLIKEIVQSVHCEVRNAVIDAINEDFRLHKKYGQRRFAGWLERWGVQWALTLTAQEKSTLSPNAVWLPPSPPTAIFTLSGAATGSADATRTNKLLFLLYRGRAL
jgi:hypothetical protein